MIIVDGQKLKFLLAGRPLTVEVHREYRKGRDYAVGKTMRKATCRAIVQDIERIGGKTWRITLKYAMADRPVYLAANPAAQRADYTANPTKAARTSEGPLEAATAVDLTRYAGLARNAHDARKRAERAELPRTDRIAALELAASLGDQQAKRQLFVIDQRIQQAERKQSRESAA